MDGDLRGETFIFVKDASNTNASAALSEEAFYLRATDILSIYSKVKMTEQLLAECGVRLFSYCHLSDVIS